MFTAALFTIAKLLKRPRSLSLEEWVKKWICVCAHTGILLSHEKEIDLAICDNLDRPRQNYAK